MVGNNLFTALGFGGTGGKAVTLQAGSTESSLSTSASSPSNWVPQLQHHTQQPPSCQRITDRVDERPEVEALLQAGSVEDGNGLEELLAREREDTFDEELALCSPQWARHSETFIWNSRPCAGNVLHKAALTNDLDEMKRILDKYPSLVTSRFTYQTLFSGQPQEGSGEAIHISASRGSVRSVELLLSRGASLNASVTRDKKDHYNSLHAAVFAEGRGGTERLVSFLLEHGVENAPNLDGRWPLHLAFQTGQARLIPLLRENTRLIGRLDEVEGAGAREPTPLMVGIQMRKLGEGRLAEAAALTPESLAVFMHHEPKCIPSFLERLIESEGSVRADKIAQLIKAKDLPKVIIECPEAAEALLTALTRTPKCESEGWHPLPSRISFAPKSIWQIFQDILNPERQLTAMYMPEKDWRYDTTTFQAPTWHEQFTDTRWSRPIRDVNIKVCQVPDLACPDFLAALGQVTDDDHLHIYHNNVIKCVLDVVWWKSAIKVDILNFMLSIWGLVLLILETVLLDADVEGIDATPNRLSTEFIAARSVVEVGHELTQFLGLWKLGRCRDYFDMGNAYDLFRCVLPAIMFADRHNRAIRILVILSYWMRLLEVNFSESMSRELLPIVRLAHGLGPASIVAFIGFCGLTHAFCALGDYEQQGSEVVLKSFSMLITGEITAGGSEDKLRMSLTYVSVLLFTVFFLNIFIGVIGENYSIQKALSPVIFQKVRGGICSTYLLRASVIPGNLCPPWFAALLALSSVAITLFVQHMRFAGYLQQSPLAIVFVMCQLVLLVSCYQNPDLPWSGCRSLGNEAMKPHYIWFAEAQRKERLSQLDRMEHGLSALREGITSAFDVATSPSSCQATPTSRHGAHTRGTGRSSSSMSLRD